MHVKKMMVVFSIDFDIQINNLGKAITRRTRYKTKHNLIDENNNVVNMSSKEQEEKNLEYSPKIYGR